MVFKYILELSIFFKRIQKSQQHINIFGIKNICFCIFYTYLGFIYT